MVTCILGCNFQNRSRSVSNIVSYDSFVHVQISNVDLSDNFTESNEKQIFGSGIIIKSDRNETLILTAGHVCSAYEISDDTANGEFIMSFITIKNWSNITVPAEIVAVDFENDLCMLMAPPTNLPSVKLSRINPDVGDRVFNISAPYAMFGNKFVLTFEGIYSGEIRYENEQIYTIPAAPGSSGSPVLNERGHLIGMIHSATNIMENVAIGPRTDIVLDFIEKYN
jgi:S1-C subfamily serine protease